MRSRHDAPAHVPPYAQALPQAARQTRLQPQVIKPKPQVLKQTASSPAHGARAQPPNTTWHHYHDYAPGPHGAYGRGTMYLMDSVVHNNIAHDGGVWQFTQAHGIAYLP